MHPLLTLKHGEVRGLHESPLQVERADVVVESDLHGALLARFHVAVHVRYVNVPPVIYL